jgi:hypothetical protein
MLISILYFIAKLQPQLFTLISIIMLMDTFPSAYYLFYFQRDQNANRFCKHITFLLDILL